jgi:23S rRNA (adenine2030-N6)-methyltransferase
VAAANPAGALSVYPGSPAIAAHLMREQDRMIANELHPHDHDSLARLFLHDPRVTVTALDAAHCIKSRLPPPERRGISLIDPPYEGNDEADRAVRMLMQGLRRFATGVFMLWYPLKANGPAEEMAASISAGTAAPVLRAELRVREEFKGGGLAGSGLFIVNPPWQLDAELQLILPALARRLGLGAWGQGQAVWLNAPD